MLELPSNSTRTHAKHSCSIQPTISIFMTAPDKILKGAKPAALPVEQPTKFKFVVKFEDRQADRPHDSTERAGAGG
jgi:hypothetical protein